MKEIIALLPVFYISKKGKGRKKKTEKICDIMCTGWMGLKINYLGANSH